ncbi:hypothetical protein PAPYR_3496 [Paratrimastix pyriformis]|uniref:F-box domain-containing protein n=1 Tax=Paratrimastix pyriformis TaxID=342808 RepID=A0ABQ8UMQ5_9EUKA|nr:hypothetical protein PAPYR_3496 [Paratrimastix pyriformis]
MPRKAGPKPEPTSTRPRRACRDKNPEPEPEKEKEPEKKEKKSTKAKRTATKAKAEEPRKKPREEVISEEDEEVAEEVVAETKSKRGKKKESAPPGMHPAISARIQELVAQFRAQDQADTSAAPVGEDEVAPFDFAMLPAGILQDVFCFVSFETVTVLSHAARTQFRLTFFPLVDWAGAGAGAGAGAAVCHAWREIVLHEVIRLRTLPLLGTRQQIQYGGYYMGPARYTCTADTGRVQGLIKYAIHLRDDLAVEPPRDLLVSSSLVPTLCAPVRPPAVGLEDLLKRMPHLRSVRVAVSEVNQPMMAVVAPILPLLGRHCKNVTHLNSVPFPVGPGAVVGSVDVADLARLFPRLEAALLDHTFASTMDSLKDGGAPRFEELAQLRSLSLPFILPDPDSKTGAYRELFEDVLPRCGQLRRLHLVDQFVSTVAQPSFGFGRVPADRPQDPAPLLVALRGCGPTLAVLKLALTENVPVPALFELLSQAAPGLNTLEVALRKRPSTGPMFGMPPPAPAGTSVVTLAHPALARLSIMANPTFGLTLRLAAPALQACSAPPRASWAPPHWGPSGSCPAAPWAAGASGLTMHLGLVVSGFVSECPSAHLQSVPFAVLATRDAVDNFLSFLRTSGGRVQAVTLSQQCTDTTIGQGPAVADPRVMYFGGGVAGAGAVPIRPASEDPPVPRAFFASADLPPAAAACWKLDQGGAPDPARALPAARGPVKDGWQTVDFLPILHRQLAAATAVPLGVAGGDVGLSCLRELDLRFPARTNFQSMGMARVRRGYRHVQLELEGCLFDAPARARVRLALSHPALEKVRLGGFQCGELLLDLPALRALSVYEAVVKGDIYAGP